LDTGKQERADVTMDVCVCSPRRGIEADVFVGGSRMLGGADH
jgi:hypothetical protein